MLMTEMKSRPMTIKKKVVFLFILQRCGLFFTAVLRGQSVTLCSSRTGQITKDNYEGYSNVQGNDSYGNEGHEDDRCDNERLYNGVCDKDAHVNNGCDNLHLTI